MTFSRIQYRVVTGRKGQNRHFYLLGLLDSPLCRKCRVGEENSADILRECEVLASHRQACLGSFFLEPEDIRSLDLVPSGTIVRLWGSHDLIWGTKDPS